MLNYKSSNKSMVLLTIFADFHPATEMLNNVFIDFSGEFFDSNWGIIEKEEVRIIFKLS